MVAWNRRYFLRFLKLLQLTYLPKKYNKIIEYTRTYFLSMFTVTSDYIFNNSKIVLACKTFKFSFKVTNTCCPMVYSIL